VEGKERKGTERGFVFVWYGFVRERERERRKQEKNIIFIIENKRKQIPLNEIEMKNIRDEREMVKVQVNYKSVLLV